MAPPPGASLASQAALPPECPRYPARRSGRAIFDCPGLTPGWLGIYEVSHLPPVGRFTAERGPHEAPGPRFAFRAANSQLKPARSARAFLPGTRFQVGADLRTRSGVVARCTTCLGMQMTPVGQMT